MVQKKVIMTNKVIRQASKCAKFVAEKTRFLRQKSNKKTGWKKIDPKFFIYETQFILKHVVILFEKKNTENINPKVSKTSNDKRMLSLKCAVCDSKESRFMKKQEAKGILSRLGLKTPLSKIPLFGDILF